MAYQSVNPNDGKLLQSFEHHSNAQLETALAAADQCFQSWKRKSYAERAVVINRGGPPVCAARWTTSPRWKPWRWASASAKPATR